LAWAVQILSHPQCNIEDSPEQAPENLRSLRKIFRHDSLAYPQQAAGNALAAGFKILDKVLQREVKRFLDRPFSLGSEIVGKPVQNDVKEKILRESIRLFLARGFRGTSIKEITEAAGVARGTLYWYYKSKNEILQDVFKKFDTEFVDPLKQIVESCEGPFPVRYGAFHKFATEFARDNRDLSLAFNALLNEIVGTHTEGESLAKTVYEKFRRVIISMLEEGRRDGSIGKDIDPSIYAHIILASHTGMLVQWFVTDKGLDVAVFTKTFKKFILKGLAGGRS
jgi:AcrR family transcriptional regulator